MQQGLDEFAKWLEATPFSLAIQNTPWAIPAMQSVHVLAVALVFWSALAIDLRLLKVIGRTEPATAYTDRYMPVAWWGLAALLASGAILIIGEPDRTLTNWTFQVKMATLLVALALTVVLLRGLKKSTLYWEASASRALAVMVIVALSILAWSAIIFAGRWIAYT